MAHLSGFHANIPNYQKIKKALENLYKQLNKRASSGIFSCEKFAGKITDLKWLLLNWDVNEKKPVSGKKLTCECIEMVSEASASKSLKIENEQNESMATVQICMNGNSGGSGDGDGSSEREFIIATQVFTNGNSGSDSSNQVIAAVDTNDAAVATEKNANDSLIVENDKQSDVPVNDLPVQVVADKSTQQQLSKAKPKPKATNAKTKRCTSRQSEIFESIPELEKYAIYEIDYNHTIIRKRYDRLTPSTTNEYESFQNDVKMFK